VLETFTRIIQSIFPGWRNPDRVSQRPAVLRSFLLHFRPTMVSARSIKLSLSWALGATATILIAIIMATGLLLKFVYIPSPEGAYASVVQLNQQVEFGRLFRNLHRWGANALLLVVFLHFLRVFYSGAYTPPRQFNWVIGLGLFALVTLSNFTGYLLPWDQLAYWAITISTSMLDYIPLIGPDVRVWILGGEEPGATTLANFYAIHTAVLPALLLLLLSFHLWRIRKANGLVVPRTPEESLPVSDTMVPVVPYLLVRDLSLTLIVCALLLGFAMVFDAPLAMQANPGLSPNPTKAPWYFMGIQELLMHFHPLFALIVIPLFIVIFLLMVPYLGHHDPAGIWFRSRAGRKMTLITVIVTAALTVSAVVLEAIVSGANMAGPADMISNGMLPLAVLALAGLGFAALMNKLFATGQGETLQMVFTMLVTVFVSLTIIGVWFRGPGMQLTWSGG
jgi:quinol-cytochrome oxidoreductase complex cytochrome b subunit